MNEEAEKSPFEAEFEVYCEWCDEHGDNYVREIRFEGRVYQQRKVFIPKSDLNIGRLNRAISKLDNAGAKTPFTHAAQKELIAYLRTATPRHQGILTGRNGAFDAGASFLFDGYSYGIGIRAKLHPVLDSHPLNRSYPTSRGPDELKEWKRTVARPIRRSPAFVTSLCFSFVGVAKGIVEDAEGFGLRLLGPPSIGRTCLEISASVWGRPDRFVRDWTSTAGSLEVLAALHSHTLLVLDETGVMRSARPLETLLGGVTTLMEGAGKQRIAPGLRLGSAVTMLLTTSERGLDELAKKDNADLSPWHGGRLVEVPMVCDGLLSIRDEASTGQEDEKFHRQLRAAARLHFGVAGDEALKRADEYIATHSSCIVADWIKQDRSSFLTDVMPQPKNEAEQRIAADFAAIYAAGALMKTFEVLPFTYDEIFEACQTELNQALAYRRQARVESEQAAIDVVRSFLDTARVTQGNKDGGGDAEEVIEVRDSNREEVWIDPGALKRHLKDMQSLESIVRGISRAVQPTTHPGGKVTVPRQRHGGRKRYLVFSGTVCGLRNRLRARLDELLSDEEASLMSVPA